MYCSACGSDALRKLSFVYERGLTLGESTIAVGVAPPRRRPCVTATVTALATAALAIAVPAMWIFAAASAAFAGVCLYWNLKRWPMLRADWDRRFVCERCGSIVAVAGAS